jgi:hypothetical protein
MKKFTVLAVVAVFVLAVGNVFALPVVPGTNANEPSLQKIFDDTILGGSINVIDDQSEVGAWYISEAAVDSYLITKYRGDNGVLGIYSKSTGAEFDFVGMTTQASFGINDAGALYINNALADANFGDSFGFYWKNLSTPLMSYTEDAKNAPGTGYGDSNTLALRYLVRDGLKVKTEWQGGTTVEAKGNDDWILAFEDRAFGNGDGDFNDAIFYVEDMKPVPEPGTLLLLGAGLLGLVGLRKRAKK